MLTREKMEGVYVLAPTPFKKNGEFDEESFRENTRRLCEAGVHGIATTGTFGEFHTIPWPDHQRLIKALVEEARSGVYTVPGCSGVNTDEAIMKTRFAQDAGADAVMNVVPFYQALTRTEAVKYYMDLAEACPKIGIVVYNNPFTMKVLVDAEMYKEIQESPNLVGSKEIVNDFGHLMRICRETKLSHMHVDRLFVPMMMWGGRGVFSLVPVLTKPKLVLEAYQAAKSKDWERAARLQEEINRFASDPEVGRLLSGYTWICASKAIVNAFGFINAGYPRRPFIPVPEDVQAKVKEILLRKYALS
ncbi:MAG: dihydrodipicolinate synthase family protein [Candidatus Bathyarchaeia archaeon]